MSKSIYLKNKYTKTYNRIIERAKYRPKPTDYTENHHTIPQCITKYLGLPESETVALTGKEHFIVHHFLMKMVSGELKAKMWLAFNRMGHVNPNQQNKRIVNAKMFERIKIANRVLCSGENSPRFGKKFGPLSEETKNKISVSKKGKITKNLGKKLRPHTEEENKKNSEAHKHPHSKEHIKNQAESHSKIWKIIYPNNKEITIRNLNQFCKKIIYLTVICILWHKGKIPIIKVLDVSKSPDINSLVFPYYKPES
jgi:hypothetical protein